MKTLNVLAVATALTFTSAASFAKTVDYKIDPTHTATVFTWDHFGFSTPSGNFTDIQGVIKVDEKNPELAASGTDLSIREKVAFALGQVKRFDEAVKELETCIAREPENFYSGGQSARGSPGSCVILRAAGPG